MPRPIVAIVGRPNVGKSSLFNRIIRRRRAVVDPTPGVTRDRVMAEADWNGRPFILVDTGGLVPGTSDRMELHVADQVKLALDQAALVVFLTDAQTGVTDLDAEVARMLRKDERRPLLVVNKVDDEGWETDWHEFYALGMGEPIPVSAVSGRHVGDLLDRLVAALPPACDEDEEGTESIKVAILGRPNVGKSSLVNALVGSQQVVVDDAPGTTRDSTDTPVEFEGRRFVLIDTAGLRRAKAVWKSRDAIEYYSTLRAINAIERCDVVVLVIEAAEHLVKQDQDIIDQVLAQGKALTIAANKWDLIPDKVTDTAGAFVKELWARNPFTTYLPVTLISAKTGQRVHRVFADVRTAHEQWVRRVETSELNTWLTELVRTNPPPISRHGVPRLKYVSQVGVRPPTFVFFVNNPRFLSEQSERYLERSLRERFGFAGTPIRMKFKRK